jgi:hypothetical protein
MQNAGNRPWIERVEQQYDQGQEAIKSYRQTVALPLHHVPEQEVLAGTTSSVDQAQATLKG